MNVRYDGGHKMKQHPLLTRWQAEKRLISFCPEVAAGLGIPRDQHEISGADGGAGVFLGRARILSASGADHTPAFLKAADQALELARSHEIKIAILKDGSPTCAPLKIYDGSFSGQKISGLGVTAYLLAANGIRVFSEEQIDEVDRYLKEIN